MTCNINKNNITLLQPSINFTNILVQLETMNKLGCIVLADLLESYGVRRIVVSPGSRNAPLIVALARSGRYRLTTVIDERSAAFAALGMSENSLIVFHSLAGVCWLLFIIVDFDF